MGVESQKINTRRMRGADTQKSAPFSFSLAPLVHKTRGVF